MGRFRQHLRGGKPATAFCDPGVHYTPWLANELSRTAEDCVRCVPLSPTQSHSVPFARPLCARCAPALHPSRARAASALRQRFDSRAAGMPMARNGTEWD